jgi:hypothetical protein
MKIARRWGELVQGHCREFGYTRRHRDGDISICQKKEMTKKRSQAFIHREQNWEDT